MAQTLEQTLDQLAHFIPQWEQQSVQVSQAPVGWHIEHAFLVIRSIIKALEKSDPSAYQKDFNPGRAFILTAGRFPRGAKSPRFTRPEAVLTPEELMASLEKTKSRLKNLTSLAPQHHFVHPYLGTMGLSESQRFMVVHTRHHMRIIQDILN